METMTTTARQATRNELPSGFTDFVRDYFKEHVDIIDGEYMDVDTSDYLNDEEPYVDFYISAFVYNRYSYEGREIRFSELEGKPAKVSSINGIATYLITAENTMYEVIAGDKDITPLHLTLEILKNNGFEQGESVGDFTVSYRKDEIFLEYDWSEDKIYFQDFYRSVGCVELQFVHQLQHLLGVLGMDDDLRLWTWKD